MRKNKKKMWSKPAPNSAKERPSNIKNQVVSPSPLKSKKLEQLENKISEFIIEDELLDL